MTSKTSAPFSRRIVALALFCSFALGLLTACDSSTLPQVAAREPAPTATAVVAPSATAEPAPPTLTPAPATATVNEATPTPRPSTPTATTLPAVGIGSTPTTASPAMPSATPEATVLTRAQRLNIFDDVWNTVHDRYLYSDFHGVDWNAMKAKYRPQAAAASTAAGFYRVVDDMILELKDDHSNYLSPQEAREQDALYSGKADYVGIGILSSYEENTVLVQYVFPGSPAEGAGVRRRDRITAVDGKPVAPEDRDASRIRGRAGTPVRLTLRSPGRPEREITITRARVTGTISPDARRLESSPGVGYLLVQSLETENMTDEVQTALTALLNGPPLQGLVVDMRANGGGYRNVLEGLLGNFVQGDVGKFFSRQREYPLTIDKSPLYNRLKGVPVVVLVDRWTESYAEVFSASLQESGRAKVVGATSAGNTETIYPYDFSDGSRLWIAQEGFRLSDGTNLEGRGVIPDVTVDADWSAFAEAEDPQILKAVEMLQAGKSR